MAREPLARFRRFHLGFNTLGAKSPPRHTTTMHSRYDIEGRLADVIAAVTVLAAAKESEGTLRMWSNRLSRPSDNRAGKSLEHWKSVFDDHPEFFLVYEWEGDAKAALRLRYANKTIDRNTGQPAENLHQLTAKQRGELTSAPLDAATTNALVNTAMSLHQATLARKADARFYFQTFGPALLALIGAILGTLAPIALKQLSSTPSSEAGRVAAHAPAADRTKVVDPDH